MASVTLEKLEKQYPNGFKAVHGIDLEIKDGEFMVFVGPSGCAKSTTLRMIAGLEEVTGGNIKIGEDIVNEIAPKDRRIAMVFQNYALYPHMNVYSNMAFSLKMKKVPKNEIEIKVKEAAKILELEDLLDRKPKELSGGQRQRVAVGRAIVRDPKVFLFDEPLSNLDAKLRVHMRVELAQLHKKLKTTMIYVTHDQVEAMTMGDRICVMNFGRIMQVDTPINLYKQPENKFVAGFIGSPTMNFIKGTLEKNGSEVTFKVNDLSLKIPKEKGDKIESKIGEQVWLGIRPESISVNQNNGGQEVFGSITILENMGNDTYIYFENNDTDLIAKAESIGLGKMEHGDKVKFYYSMENCHFFDIETEESLL